MPIITVETNLSYTQFPENFGPELSKFTSETLDKPEERITISLVTDRRMWRNGSDLPMIQIHVSAIGAVSTGQQNSIHAKKFTEFIMEKTSLPIERIFLVFTPLESWQIGKNGTVAF
ncbi:hypothetical protein DAPPUDRAFT_93282 [Daphnia pulex]|uniref:D-dopachrome decarboxylase n=1 Tax=Daphnia pulex TaxID=6669 RepID=E9H786_DAPPU|nr:hypothetical protein DAPPUDRAFT_93282 [Daphnia pulex]|eukprot:EFX72336.1 hypothetical protein DAPPUDRAFT_93282 [Daphnia pulex]